jgi:lipopolysaccharide biosynthesis protein
MAGPSPTERGRPKVRLIAFHLPQFHPIPENDRWWEPGFTEWTNVTKAQPLFKGHLQPRLPADLGFYDLRLPEARAAQAELARRFGIEGFCDRHSWFHGDRLLGRPLDEILSSGQPDFPFCLAWANESWSRSWLGDDREILVGQTYSDEDDRAHARWLSRVFADPRYIRIHGRPMFVVYRPLSLPDARRTTDTLRQDREERVIFINAWNEWAEGMYLEPDRTFGHGYLNAVASVLEDIEP